MWKNIWILHRYSSASRIIQTKDWMYILVVRVSWLMVDFVWLLMKIPTLQPNAHIWQFHQFTLEIKRILLNFNARCKYWYIVSFLKTYFPFFFSFRPLAFSHSQRWMVSATLLEGKHSALFTLILIYLSPTFWNVYQIVYEFFTIY